MKNNNQDPIDEMLKSINQQFNEFAYTETSKHNKLNARIDDLIIKRNTIRFRLENVAGQFHERRELFVRQMKKQLQAGLSGTISFPDVYFIVKNFDRQMRKGKKLVSKPVHKTIKKVNPNKKK